MLSSSGGQGRAHPTEKTKAVAMLPAGAWRAEASFASTRSGRSKKTMTTAMKRRALMFMRALATSMKRGTIFPWRGARGHGGR